MIRIRFAGRVLVLMLLILSLGGPVLAQFSSGIEGTLREASGAVVVGAKVTVTNTQLGVEETATTNDSGYFRISSLAASTYTGQIQLSGFATWKQNDLVLQVGETRTLSPFSRSEQSPPTSLSPLPRSLSNSHRRQLDQ